MGENVIAVRDLYKKYGDGETLFEALKGISLTIEKGSFVSIVGKSGSGKSTLLHLMASLDDPSSGAVSINGTDLIKLSKKEKCMLRNKQIGFIFQSFYIEENYTVYKNIEMPLIISGIPASKRKKMIYDVLERVDMMNKVKLKAAKLSGGEKQRVAIARAIVNHPQIVFADEPCGNLDSENGQIVIEMLKNLVEQGVTVVLVTHNNEDARKTERIITLKDGMIVGDELC